MNQMEYRNRQQRAPGIFGDFWFNGEPFSLGELQGYVLLVEFWDYASAGSLRSLEYVKEWHRKYAGFGLVVLGVHTPALHFGRKRENLESAIKELGIGFPVVADNEGIVWSAFNARTWPTQVLIDKDGFIRHTRSGERGYLETERMIQSLLGESGLRGDLPDLTPPLHETDIPGILSHKATFDIAAGYLRGALGNPEGFSPEGVMEYSDQGYYLQGRFYLKGKWMNEKEFVRFQGGKSEEGLVTIRYEGTDVFAVLGPALNERDESPGAPSTFRIRQNGEWLPASKRGKDVYEESDGSTAVLVRKPGIFNLVQNKDFGEYLLTLQTKSLSAHVYLFSFGTSPIPEVIHSN